MAMHKPSIIIVSALALVGSIAVAKPPFKSSPTFTDNGTTLTVAGNLAGLGSGDLEVTLSATGTETVVCADSGGMDPPPKQVELIGSKVVSVPLDKKIAATFADLVSSAPPAPTCAQSGDDVIAAPQHDVAFTNASIEIRPVQTDPAKPPLKPVRCIQCSFKLPTVDGPASPQSCFTMSSC